MRVICLTFSNIVGSLQGKNVRTEREIVNDFKSQQFEMKVCSKLLVLKYLLVSVNLLFEGNLTRDI